MIKRCLLVSGFLLSACNQTSFYEGGAYAEAHWARAFAAMGCSQPTAGLPERIAAHTEFTEQSIWRRFNSSPSGSPERASYLRVVSNSYYQEALGAGVVVLSDNGATANLTVQGCHL